MAGDCNVAILHVQLYRIEKLVVDWSEIPQWSEH